MKFKDLIMYDEDEKEERKKLPAWTHHAVFLGIWVLFLNFLAIIYITKSEYIYFWDNATYWDISKKIAEGALKPDIFSNIYNSIGNMDYNYVAGLLSALIEKIFGESRLVYILSLVNLYLAPVMLITYLIARKIGKSPKITLTLIMFLCPMIVFITFVGFVDIGGVIGCLLCFYWYYESKNKTPEFWKFIAIGITLVLIMVWRRWYAFFTVSFITAMAADCIINKKKWYLVLITILTSAALLMLCFRDFTFNILLKDYGNIYSGYKFSPSLDFKIITRYFGIIYLLVLLVSSITIMIKKADCKPIFMWIQMVVCACMFIATQTHGQQHLLLYVPSIIMLTIIVIKNITKYWMLVAITALAIIDTTNVFIPHTQPDNIQEIKHYASIPNFSMLSKKRDDTYQMLDLKLKLDGIVGENEKLGVLASSFNFNEDILRNVEASLGVKRNREDYIVSLPQVDSRDLDLTAYSAVNYVLCVTPAQTHLADGSQRVIEEAVNEFNTWTGIAMSFEEVYDFDMQINGMEMKLFKRVRDIPEYEYKTFSIRAAQ